MTNKSTAATVARDAHDTMVRAAEMGLSFEAILRHLPAPVSGVLDEAQYENICWMVEECFAAQLGSIEEYEEPEYVTPTRMPRKTSDLSFREWVIQEEGEYIAPPFVEPTVLIIVWEDFDWYEYDDCCESTRFAMDYSDLAYRLVDVPCGVDDVNTWLSNNGHYNFD